jgi:hypothetical protein
MAVLAGVTAGCSKEDPTAPETLVMAAAVPPKPVAPIRYGRDIRPILSDRCFGCHGPDANKRKENLRLDLAESATAPRDESAAIVPGSKAQSLVWARINHHDPEEVMPPPDSNRRALSAEEKERIGRWIDQGAVYEPHWAFTPPQRPFVPSMADDGWCRNDIDRFIFARLEQEGVPPSAEADRETLVRRVTLDLTGLPPTPEEIDAFVADDRPDALERWVDRLLTEEPWRTRYAERMAVPWLDQARYADTCGIHMDAGRTIWPWRDWVLRAYRDNMPFDRFLTEQLAGDLLPDATDQQKVASGFNRNHVTTDEGGAIPEEYLVEYAVDRASTTGAVFLGLTMGCARCHEHKFDPISQDEFYQFYAFFNSIEEPGLYSQLPDPKRAFEPFMAVPTPEQKAELAELAAKIEREKRELETPVPEDEAQRAAFLAELPAKMGLGWEAVRVVGAEAGAGGATLTVQGDGSVLASGKNPDQDEHTIMLETEATGLRLISLEALTDASMPEGKVGRAFNGNAVLTGVSVEAASVADPTQRQEIRPVWAWADHEQGDGDFRVVNVLDTSDDRGWAVDAHRRPDGRVAVLLAEQPFGYEGGTRLTARLQYKSIYAKHTLGRVRLGLGRIGEEGLRALPVATGTWHLVGPFPADSGELAYTTAFGPETEPGLDLKRNFGFGNQFWHPVVALQDGKLNGDLPQGTNATYVGRTLYVPAPTKLDLSLGSDDGFRLFLNGTEVASKQIDRSLAADQDRATIELPAGTSTLVMKIVNTGGAAGFYYKPDPVPDQLAGPLVAAILPDAARSADLNGRMVRAWREAFSPDYRRRTQRLAELEKRHAEVDGEVPRTMIMKELPQPRETFVLMRGVYDKPDKSRPAPRGVPAVLGALPEGVPRDRLGLAQWLVSAENPLVARVAMNRLWEMLFGTGLVRTSEDFGHQGEWPSHPELLDWLAVEFREGGWDVQKMLKLMVTSSTYRQSSRVRPEVKERDPDNRLLAYFPRRRLLAEQIRDQALFVSGLLVEKMGGPSVKPYQPMGLWEEVAMPQSNTRIFQRGEGEELWRRSMYTYWKRAAPAPAMLTLDAPTRESCTIRRPTTNTPLQALVLWNDEQFVEAARELALRVLEADVSGADDQSRLTDLFRRCTGRRPDKGELDDLGAALGLFRARFREAPDDARGLLEAGERPVPDGIDRAELAAWTMIASSVLNLDSTICRG